MLFVDKRLNCLCLQNGVEDVTIEPPMVRIPLLYKFEVYLFQYTMMYRHAAIAHLARARF